MQDVASDAGVTKAALYYHFTDKVDLYAQVLLSQVDAVRQAIDEAVGTDGTLEARLTRVASVAQRRFERDVMGLMIAAHQHLDEERHLEVHAALNGVQAGVARCFRETPGASEPALSPELAAMLFFALIASVSLQTEARIHGHPAIGGLSSDPDERSSLIVGLFLDGYRGVSGANRPRSRDRSASTSMTAPSSGRPERGLGPRIFAIGARDAGTYAVIRRGPSAWCLLSRWEPDRGEFQAGSWVRATIYPQRCDLSPDGRWFVALFLKATARWDVGDTYLSISRLPWLTSLAAWRTCGTWTRGLHFVADRARLDPGEPDDGDVGPLKRRYGLAATRAVTFAVERRAGWQETEDTPPRAEADMWDERRADRVTMWKACPADASVRLRVSGRHAAFRDMAPAWGSPRYELEVDGRSVLLDDAQWADWSSAGSLLVATRAGALEVREAPYGVDQARWREDLARLRPSPTPPPPEASSWGLS